MKICVVALEQLLEDEIAQKYPRFIRHLERSYLGRRDMWAHCTRYEEGYRHHGNNTNNLVEVSFRVMKDCLFGRTKVTLVKWNIYDEDILCRRTTYLTSWILFLMTTNNFVCSLLTLAMDGWLLSVNQNIKWKMWNSAKTKSLGFPRQSSFVRARQIQTGSMK